MAKARGNGKVVDAVVIPGSSRRAPKKPSEQLFVRLPDEQPESLFDPSLNDEPPAQRYMDAALQGVMMDLGARDDDAKVTVKRISVDRGVKREEWLYECHPSEFSIPTLQDFYGAGDYRITVFGQQEGSNYRVIHADKKLSIGAPINAVKKDAANVPAAPGGFGAVEIQRAISEAMGGPLTALAQVIAQAMPKASSRAETFAELKQMAELFGAMRQAPAASADPLEMLTRTLALAKSIAPTPSPLAEGADGAELNPNFVLAKGIELVKSFMDAHAASASAPQQAALSAPQSPPLDRSAPVAPVSQSDPEAAAVGIALKMQLKILLNAAGMNADTETYSALIFEQAPDEVIETLRGSDWFEKLVQLEPGFAPYRAWADKVRAEVVAMLAEDETLAGDTLTTKPQPGKTQGDAMADAPGATAADNPARNP